ncbi:MAG: hypothetical protein A2X30_07355 [Elusimicrobia bacterium GWB2_63_16]|nr:MAG: hypothetical protein A2X30_07355 [Elusimicrobia bacterium GWB2_63_16]
MGNVGLINANIPNESCSLFYLYAFFSHNIYKTDEIVFKLADFLSVNMYIHANEICAREQGLLDDS